jgi:hypothetical protein
LQKNANYFKTFLTSTIDRAIDLTHIAVSQVVFPVPVRLFCFFRILPYYEHLPVFFAKSRSTDAVFGLQAFL